VSGLVAATRTALASAALLSTPARGVLDEDLAQRVRALVDLLEAAGVPFAEEASAALARGDFASLLEPLVDAGLVSRSQDGARGLVHFDEQARHALDYYRATLAHALAPAGAAALALLAAESPTREEALAEAARWLDLLRLDVLPPPEAERQRDLERILERFAAQGWIEESAERLAPTADGRQLLPLVAAQIRPALEAYGAVFEVVLEAQGSGTRAGLERDALAAIRRHLLVGEAAYAEAACPAAQAQAIPWLLREGMLATRSSQPAKGAAVPLEPGPRFGELKRWQARVAAAASSR
jgi:glycerol-3-phosphate O-acyltransferase